MRMYDTGGIFTTRLSYNQQAPRHGRDDHPHAEIDGRVVQVPLEKLAAYRVAVDADRPVQVVAETGLGGRGRRRTQHTVQVHIQIPDDAEIARVHRIRRLGVIPGVEEDLGVVPG